MSEEYLIAVAQGMGSEWSRLSIGTTPTILVATRLLPKKVTVGAHLIMIATKADRMGAEVVEVFPIMASVRFGDNSPVSIAVSMLFEGIQKSHKMNFVFTTQKPKNAPE